MQYTYLEKKGRDTLRKSEIGDYTNAFQHNR